MSLIQTLAPIVAPERFGFPLPLAGLPFDFDPTKQVLFFDDFLDDRCRHWDITRNQTGAMTVASTPALGGVLRVSPNGAAESAFMLNGTLGLGAGLDGLPFAVSKNAIAEWRMSINTLPADNGNGTCRQFGFMAPAAATLQGGNPTDIGIYFKGPPAAITSASLWSVGCRNGGGETLVATANQMDTGKWHTFRIMCYAGRGVAEFYVDDQLVATIGANVLTTGMGWAFSAANAGTGGGAYDFDYLLIMQDR